VRKARLELLVSVLLAGLLLFFNGVPSGAFCATVGLGVSDYEVNANVTVGETAIFDLARVSNEGEVGFTIMPTWKNMTGLTVVFLPEQAHLDSGEAVLFKGEVVDAEQTGLYAGLIEFVTVVDVQEGGGNPSNPAGVAHATFHVVSEAVAWDEVAGSNSLLIGLLVAVVVVALIAAVLVWRKKR